MEKEAILNFCYSSQYEKLSESEKRKCAAVYSDYQNSDVARMEEDAKIKKTAQLLKMLPDDVFIENIVLASDITGREVISVCASDPLFREKCNYKNGLLYRKLLARDFQYRAPEEISLEKLKTLYLELNKGYMYFTPSIIKEKKWMKDYLPRIPEVKNLTKYVALCNYVNKQNGELNDVIVGLTTSGNVYTFDTHTKLLKRQNYEDVAKLFSVSKGRVLLMKKNGTFLFGHILFNRKNNETVLKSGRNGRDVIDFGLQEPIKEVYKFDGRFYLLTESGNLYSYRMSSPIGNIPSALEKVDIPPVKRVKLAKMSLVILTENNRCFSVDRQTLEFEEYYPESKIIDAAYSLAGILFLYEDGSVKSVSGFLSFKIPGATEIFSDLYMNQVYANTEELKVYRVLLESRRDGIEYTIDLIENLMRINTFNIGKGQIFISQ